MRYPMTGRVVQHQKAKGHRTIRLGRMVGVVLALVVVAFVMGAWPYLVQAQEPNAPASLQNPLSPSGGAVNPNELFARVAGSITLSIGAATMFFAVLGGYIILTAAGNSERYEKGKKTVTYALIGFIIVVGSYALLSTALNVATGWKGLATFERFRLTDPLGITSGADLYGGRLAKFFVSGLGALTVLMVVYGGLQWVVAAGNQEKITKAKQTLTYAFVGLMIVMCSYIVINFIYTPIYNLLNNGQAPQETLTVAADLASTKPVACFRLPIVGGVKQDYGAVCTLETPNDCLKATGTAQRGGYLLNFTDCSKVGACVQKLPGTFFKNRVADKTCQAGNPSGMKTFEAISYSNIDGSCPFKDTVAMYTGNTVNGGYERKCWADVDFVDSADMPHINKFACVREKLNADGTKTRKFDCAEDTAFACSRGTADGSHAGGTFYSQLQCSDVGYCQQNWSGHYACKDGMVAQKCTPQLFQSVGVPVPPWGCGYYQEINGRCYVPESGISFHTSGSSGTHCPYSH